MSIPDFSSPHKKRAENSEMHYLNTPPRPKPKPNKTTHSNMHPVQYLRVESINSKKAMEGRMARRKKTGPHTSQQARPENWKV